MTEEESEKIWDWIIGLHSRLQCVEIDVETNGSRVSTNSRLNQVEANLMYINQEKFVQIVKRLDEIDSRLIQLSVLNKVLKAAIEP